MADFILDEPFARILTEATQSLICVLDHEGRILLFNDACERATGFARDDVLGRNARDCVIPPEERDAFGEFLAHVWKTGSPSPQVGHWLTKAGERRLIAWSNKPLAAPDGEFRSLVTSGIDLTDRAPLTEGERALGGDAEAKLVEISRLAAEQKALRRVATLVASEVSPERVFNAVSEECARVLQVNATAVLRYEGDGTVRTVGRFNRDGIDVFRVGETVPIDERGALGHVLRSGAPARVDDWGGRSGEMAEMIFLSGYRSTAAVPIMVAGVLWGAVAIAGEDALPPGAEGRLAGFCELVSLAMASAQARADLIASRARLVKAGDEQRRRLERNLHDGAQQRLVSLALMLRVARSRLADPEAAPALLDAAARELDTGLEELREIARGLHPAILSEHGLHHALQVLAERLPVPVTLEAPAERLREDVEATAYYIVSEALTNVVRHAAAGAAAVTVRRDGALLRCEVSDDGRGGADPAAGTGILGLRDRAEAAGGTLSVLSPTGRGTTVTAALPL